MNVTDIAVFDMYNMSEDQIYNQKYDNFEFDIKYNNIGELYRSLKMTGLMCKLFTDRKNDKWIQKEFIIQYYLIIINEMLLYRLYEYEHKKYDKYSKLNYFDYDIKIYSSYEVDTEKYADTCYLNRKKIVSDSYSKYSKEMRIGLSDTILDILKLKMLRVYCPLYDYVWNHKRLLQSVEFIHLLNNKTNKSIILIGNYYLDNKSGHYLQRNVDKIISAKNDLKELLKNYKDFDSNKSDLKIEFEYYLETHFDYFPFIEINSARKVTLNYLNQNVFQNV